MKSLLFFRRSALLALFVAASLTGCKKSNSDPAPAPDLASRLAGQYTLSEVSSGGKTYKASETNLKGGINITRQTPATVSLSVNFQLKTGETYAEDTVDNVAVTESSSGNVEFRSSGTVIARANGNKVSIVGEGPDGNDLTLTSTK